MQRPRTGRVLAVLACLLLAAPAGGAETAPAQDPAAAVAEAAGLVRNGAFERALALLRPHARGREVDANVLFHIGLAAIGASQLQGVPGARRGALLDEAIGVLRAMLVARPALVRVRLELARAFFLKEEDRLARRHFEHVLAGKPPAAVALNVNRFLNAMRARKRWSLRVGMALAPDSNIGAASDERIIYIHGLPFRRDAEKLTTSGIGVSAWLGGEYQYPLGHPGTGSGAGSWRLRAGGDLSRREYKASAFDQLTVSGHVGPRRLIGRGSEVSLLLTGLHHWTGSGLSEPSHHDIGLRIEGRHRLTPRTILTARVSHARRRHDRETYRDGPITDVSLGAGWVASPTLRIDAGLGWGRERTRAEQWRQSSRRVRIEATALLPRGFTVGGSGALSWTGWQGNWFPHTGPGEPRRDLTRTIRLFAHNRALTLEGFSPQVSLTQEQRTTNAQLYDYRRLFAELRFVRLF
ncbi:MAG: surface lipoprotein assembly modifier [Defluviicoccus sp.]|nr:surface lipoprotein assembly modifier [Defluviicoccus sp.]